MITKNGELYHSYKTSKQTKMEHHEIKQRYEKNGCIVLQHDISKGMSEDFKKCDCIYSEPAWQAGYEKFVEKSGVECLTYNDYLRNIKETVRSLGKPAFIMMGKQMVKRLDPDFTIEIGLCEYDGGKCFIGVYNAEIKEGYEIKTNHEMMDYVVENYNNILDFSCGYGSVVKRAYESGKKFIASDICLDCIGYIAENYLGEE